MLEGIKRYIKELFDSKTYVAYRAPWDHNIVASGSRPKKVYGAAIKKGFNNAILIPIPGKINIYSK